MKKNVFVPVGTKEERLFKIVNNLAKFNPNIIVNQNENGFRIYELEESNSSTKISLSNLEYLLENELNLDVQFQRDSDDHKGKTPSQIVCDFISGQILGNISLYSKNGKLQKKIVIDGKHRITHLVNFINNKLILEGNEACIFWTIMLNELNSLLDIKGDTKLNQFFETLEIENLENFKCPKVVYENLPKRIQDKINARVVLQATDINVKCYDENFRPLEPEDESVVQQLIWRKFHRMNTNSAKIDPQDIIWSIGGPYGEKSSYLVNNSKVLKTLFNITNKDKKGNLSTHEFKKLNEIVFSFMMFLDKKFPWGGSSNKLVKDCEKTHMKEIKAGAKSMEFFDIMTRQIEPNFNRMVSSGEILNIPQEFKGIGGNVTNIRQFILFLYVTHSILNQTKKFPMYNDKPTEMLKGVLELGAKIIAVSVFDKEGKISESNLRTNGVSKIYNDNKEIFHKLAEYRKNQRTFDVMISLYQDLFNICSEYTY